MLGYIKTLFSGKEQTKRTSAILLLVKRIFTNESIEVRNNEVLKLYSPILKGTTRIHLKGSGRLIV